MPPSLEKPLSPRQRIAILSPDRWWMLLEIFFIFLLFFLYAGGVPPDVNEAHYLAKAKHYWNPQWCRGDFFLESDDAHLVFYWTFGWLTQFCSLETTAWIGRLLTWMLLAWAWRRLSVAVVSQRMSALLTAAIFVSLNDWCHLAGEWVIGGVEAKGFAYVLVFLGTEAIVRGRWRWVWPLLGGAAAFHVLVGGWSIIAAGVAWFVAGKTRPSILSMLPFLLLGLLLSAPGLIPALSLTRDEDPAVIAQAVNIYVYQRLPHHLVPSEFSRDRYAWHLSLLCGWIVLALAEILWKQPKRSDTAPSEKKCDEKGRARRLDGFVLGGILLAFVGIVIDRWTSTNPELGAVILRYYWFRLSDMLLPVGVALAVGRWLARRKLFFPLAWQGGIAMLIIGLASLHGWQLLEKSGDPRPPADRQTLPASARDRDYTDRVYDDWRDVCRWIAKKTPSDESFLTPRQQQTFKWYAGRSEVVSWKDIPQDAGGVLEWKERMDAVYGRGEYPSLAHLSQQELTELAEKYHFRYIIVQNNRGPYWWDVTRVYWNTTYTVVTLPDGRP